MDPIKETHGRKLATIQRISKLSPIEGADKIEVAEMDGLGWKVVVRKGEFEVGDKALYLEIDSAIRLENIIPPFEFLKDRCLRKICDSHGNVMCELIRIKTIKMKGVVSQGLLVQWDRPVIQNLDGDSRWMCDYVPPQKFIDAGYTNGIEVGMDMTDIFNVEHYDEIVDYYNTILGVGVNVAANRTSTFPSWVPKTDEVRLQSFYGRASNDPKWRDAIYEVTEKADGSSQTVFYCPEKWPDEPFKVSSRNFILEKDPTSAWFYVLGNLDDFERNLKVLYNAGLGVSTWENSVEWVLPPKHEIAIQGEHCGAKFNGNKDQYIKDVYKVFRIFDVTDQKFLSPDARLKVCDFLGLDHVRIIDPEMRAFARLKTMDDFLEFVKGKTENGHEREGMVFKNVNDGTMSFKVINNDYLTKYKE